MLTLFCRKRSTSRPEQAPNDTHCPWKLRIPVASLLMLQVLVLQVLAMGYEDFHLVL